MSRATGTHLLFIDDDDEHARAAFRHIRRAIDRYPDRILIFRMRRFGELLWEVPELSRGSVGTPQFVVPNTPNRLGSWLTHDQYSSDFDFLTECLDLQGDPVWMEALIALAPRQSFLFQVRRKVAIRTRLRALAADRRS